MKGLFYSITGAVIAAIIILFVQSALQNKPITEINQLNYAVDDVGISLTKDELLSASKKASTVSIGNGISTVTIKNMGNVPLKDQKVVIRIGVIGDGDQRDSDFDQILKYSNISFPGGDQDSVSTKLDKDKITLIYKVINPGEMHKLSIFYEAIGSLKVSARAPGLIVQEGLEPIKTTGIQEALWVVFSIIVVGVFFLLGAAVAYVNFKSELASRGHDLDGILASPKAS